MGATRQTRKIHKHRGGAAKAVKPLKAAKPIKTAKVVKPAKVVKAAKPLKTAKVAKVAKVAKGAKGAKGAMPVMAAPGKGAAPMAAAAPVAGKGKGVPAPANLLAAKAKLRPTPVAGKGKGAVPLPGKGKGITPVAGKGKGKGFAPVAGKGKGLTPVAGKGALPGKGKGLTPVAGKGALPGKGVTPVAGKGALPGKGATPVAGKGALPGKGATPVAGKGALPGKGATPVAGRGALPGKGKGVPGTPRAAVPAPGSGKLARTGAAPPGRTTTARAGPAAGTPIQSLIVIANSADAFELVRPIVEKNAKTTIDSVENVTVGGGTRRASQRGGSTLKVTFARPISPAVVQKLKTNPALSSIQVRGPGTRMPTPAAASAMSNAANPDREGEFDWRKFATKNQPRRVPYNLLSLNDIEADSAISKSHTLSDGSVVHFTEAVIPEGDQGAALVRIPHVPGVDPATTVKSLQQQAGIQELTSGEAGYTRISDNLDRAIATVNTDIRMWKSDLKTYTASLSGLTGQDKKDRQTLIQLLQKAVDVRTRELDAFNKQKNAVALRLALLKQ